MSEGDPSQNVPPMDLPSGVPNSPPRVNPIADADEMQWYACVLLWRNLHWLLDALKIRWQFTWLAKHHQRAEDALQQRIAELFPELADFNLTLEALESLSSGEIQNQGSITAFLGHLEAAVCSRVEQIDALGHYFEPQDPDAVMPFAVSGRPLGQGNPSLWNANQATVTFTADGCDLDFDAWERDAAAAFASAGPQIEQLIDTLRTEPASLQLVTEGTLQQPQPRWDDAQYKLFYRGRVIATWSRYPSSIDSVLADFQKNNWRSPVKLDWMDRDKPGQIVSQINEKIGENWIIPPVEFRCAGGDDRLRVIWVIR